MDQRARAFKQSSYQELIGSHTRRIWNNANGKAVIEAFSINGMAHGVPLATTTGGESSGTAGAFFLVYASHRTLLAPARISR